MGEVTMKCTCAECFDSLARSDKVPWRYDESKQRFINSKHGTYVVPEDCGLRSIDPGTVGYIFIRPQYTLKEAKAGATIAKTMTNKTETAMKVREQELKEMAAEQQVDDRVNASEQAEELLANTRALEEDIAVDEETVDRLRLEKEEAESVKRKRDKKRNSKYACYDMDRTRESPYETE